jgi:hypothetical protein
LIHGWLYLVDVSFVNLPDLGISPTPEMNKITINTEGVQNLLQHLKPNKATGPDDIPAKFLKEVSIEISPLISFGSLLVDVYPLF